ncbi:hypothetical protein B0H21DRAFT_487283 [Amylocystis lapponica]|nr:hypothetical protein B0H21DRAFT_487283 [Amylocystis lapponica]
MIMVSGDPGSIEIYSFSGRAPPSVFPPLPPTHITTLCMPAVQAGQQLWGFSTHSGRCVRNTAPFASAPDSPCISSRYSTPWRTAFLSLLVQPLSALACPARFWLGRGVDDAHAPVGLVGPCAHAPPRAQCLVRLDQRPWFRYAHGQRVVLPPRSISPNPPSTLYVLHFNIHPTRTDDPVPIAESRGATWQYEVVTGPTTIPAGTVFRANVVTHLPYSMSSCSGLSDYLGFMIDDERILGMKSLPYSTGDMKSIDVIVF